MAIVRCGVYPDWKWAFRLSHHQLSCQFNGENGGMSMFSGRKYESDGVSSETVSW